MLEEYEEKDVPHAAAASCGCSRDLRAAARPEDLVIVETESDRRLLAWMIAEVGASTICEAVGRLPGARRPYPSNIIALLALTPPLWWREVAPREIGRRHLERMREMLR